MSFFRIYLLLSRLLGVCNLHYDFVSRKFEPYHKLTMCYCLTVNAVYLGLMPLASIMLIRGYYDFELFNVILVLNNFVFVLSEGAFLIAICETWRKRQWIYRLACGYMRLYRVYQQNIAALPSNHATRKIFNRVSLLKIVAYFFRLFALISWLYGHGTVRLSDSRKTLTYRLAMMYFVTQELHMIIIDWNICFALLLSNILLDMILQQLQSLRTELELLLKLQQSEHCAYHKVWYRELTKAVYYILRQQRQLKTLIDELFGVYQMQLLSMLAYFFLILILQIFRLIVILEDGQHYGIRSIIFSVLGLCLSFCNLMLLFFLCERIRRRFSDMRDLVYWIWWWRVDSNYGTMLERALEQFSLELQQQPCRLNICGFFELSMSTGMQMARAIVIHLLILLQIVVKTLLEMKVHIIEPNS